MKSICRQKMFLPHNSMTCHYLWWPIYPESWILKFLTFKTTRYNDMMFVEHALYTIDILLWESTRNICKYITTLFEEPLYLYLRSSSTPPSILFFEGQLNQSQCQLKMICSLPIFLGDDFIWLHFFKKHAINPNLQTRGLVVDRMQSAIFFCTEGPRLTRMTGPGKNRVRRNRALRGNWY